MPRLSVFRSNKNVYAQIIDDSKSITIVGLSSEKVSGKGLMQKAANVGKEIAKLAQEKGVKKVVFDRGGFLYAGKIKAVAWTETRKKQSYVGTSGNRLVSLSSGSVVLPMAAGAADTIADATASTAVVAGTPNVIDKVTQIGYGATYDFGFAKLGAMATSLKFKDATAADNGEVTSNMFGFEVPLNPKARIRGSISTGKISDNGTKTYDLDGYQIVAIYDLSKRTHLYGALGETKYDSPSANSDVKINQMGVGLRTTF
jgi:ribosomal protein L18